MKLMSVDLGKARTGIAMCDKDESLAFPKEVIKEYNTDRLVEKIAYSAKENGVELIVVGLPKNMDGSEGERAAECRQIAQAVERASGIETVMWDERCTTLSAYTALDMSGTYGKKRKESVDAVAAVIILESYLAFRKSNKQ